MNKSQLFKKAHELASKQQVKAFFLRQDFNYSVTFSFYLKELTNAQPVKVTTLKLSKGGNITTVSYEDKPASKINVACAMVGDYKKPKTENDSLELHFFILSSVAILIIFALTLQAINYL